MPPSYLHEMLIELFRGRPRLAAELLTGPPHVTVPDFETANLAPSELNDIAPTEYRADAVVTLDNPDGTAMAVVVEVQLRADPRKRRSWPAYLATLYARLGRPVALLVVCPQRSVAEWCAEPIVIGPPGSVVTPVAIGPDQVPVVTDLELARKAPEFAVLSAIAHGTQPEPIPVFKALLTGLKEIDPAQAELYTDFVFSVLPATARACLEDLMTTTRHRYHSEFAQRLYTRGKAASVLQVLTVRGIEVPDDIRDSIADCTDSDQVDTWMSQAVTAEKIQDLDGIEIGR